jgi:uncharacterized protein DUF1592/uncharacterized protein DUF1588/uncharacterized protein DUF1595/uncharacterized protein DUF1587/uncharacterized protein DUF1585
MQRSFGRSILMAIVLAGCSAHSSEGANPGSAGGGTSSGAGGSGSQPGPSSGSPSSSPGSGAQCASAPMASGNAYIRRLTSWEYTNTVTDILGWPAQTDATSLGTLTALLPADIHSNGFSNDYGGQLATLDVATGYQQAADAIGAALSTTPGWLMPFAACSDVSATCRDTIVQAVGLRLFRRPLTTGASGELASFGALFDAAVAAGKTAASDAAVVVVRAMLQSPQFLYRLESQLPPTAGAVARPLDDYEIATRLSYFLVGSAPDPTLLAAAQAGQLKAPDEVTAQVTRLQALAGARAMAQRYFREWFFLDGLDDEVRGPAFTPQLEADMKQETIDDVGVQLWDKRQPVLSLFTTQTTHVTPALAQYYGLGAPSADGSYSTASLPGRVGFLTHAGVLTENGTATASIVYRGLFMLHSVLCENVADPPPGATAVVLAPATASQRAQSDARLKTEPCMSCHGIFDPLAYAFEPFDSMGGWQTTDVNGNAVRQDGWLTVPGAAAVPYATIAAYMQLLTQDARVSSCMTNKTTQFAWGRPMVTQDACMLQDIASRTGTAQTRTFADILAGIATSPYFLYTAVQ